MSITTERNRPMTKKNPPTPALSCCRSVLSLGLDHHACSRSPWSDAQHALGTRKREARHISRNGVRLSKSSAATPKAGLCNRRSTILPRSGGADQAQAAGIRVAGSALLQAKTERYWGWEHFRRRIE